jgi:hypothetical protein
MDERKAGLLLEGGIRSARLFSEPIVIPGRQWVHTANE